MPKDRASERLKKEQARFKLFNKGRAMLPANLIPADPCKPPRISEKSDPELWAAFKFFNAEQGAGLKLNPRQNPDWWFLAEKLARIVFPRPGKAGRPEGSGKWSSGSDDRADLDRTVAEIRVKHPEWNKLKIRDELRKLERYAGIGRLTLYGLVTKRPNGRLLKRPKK